MIKKKLYKRIIVVALCGVIVGNIVTFDNINASARQHYKKAIETVKLNKEDGKQLESHLERRVILKSSGNGYVCDYSVWAMGKDLKKTVKEIKTTWIMKAGFCVGSTDSASLDCNVSMTNSEGKVSYGSVISQTKKYTLKGLEKYWKSTNGCKSVNYDSNFVISPKKYYEKDSAAMDNTAYLKLKGSTKSYAITATL